ncbi:hypothetical protein T07_4290 [Trichinella nelsoni]|uniref:Uncharacterized protein n=1 Tax=Trichinella nelsoni TaxID=6336 RepID=A0A0V0SEY3_9BILA|nr:hypothetical protein T07_4290 [Trichinella nelsoni]
MYSNGLIAKSSIRSMALNFILNTTTTIRIAISVIYYSNKENIICDGVFCSSQCFCYRVSCSILQLVAKMKLFDFVRGWKRSGLIVKQTENYQH